MRRSAALIAAALLLPSTLPAQVADTSAFRPLALPTPNACRSASGAPGHAYWQNRANYAIEVTLDTARQEIRGTARILYENRSLETLRHLWLQMDQDLFAAGSINSAVSPPPLIFGATPFEMANRDFLGGFIVERLEAAGRPVTTHRYDTMLRLDLASPLEPGRSVTLDVAWRFAIPVNGAARMGRDGPLYQIAQFYPRLAVFDDVRGWNTLPYVGTGEFYLDYGDYDLRITVPAGYVVAATGTLQNPEEVLTASQRQRLEQARRTGEAVAIITAEEAGDATRTRPTRDGSLTWRFRADDVRDVAFAAAPDYRWDAAYWDGILVQTLYRRSARLWEEAIRMAVHSIRFFSQQWHRYPYPHATTVEGPINGMEYPMLTFVPAESSRENLYWVLMHEFGHEWFPMLVGNDERRHPWMDEGFNTFINLYAFADYFRGTPPADTIFTTLLTAYRENAVPGREQPIGTQPHEVRNLFYTAYLKPALAFRLLRDVVLGPDAFDPAFREFIRRWANRHPQPADFYRTLENVTGRDLAWFWRGWIETTARLDQAVDSVVAEGTGSGQGLSGTVRIVLMNRGQMVMPTELALYYDDGSREVRRLPVEIWLLGSRFALTVDTGAKRLVGLRLDPRGLYPDIDRRNDGWGRTPQ